MSIGWPVDRPWAWNGTHAGLGIHGYSNPCFFVNFGRIQVKGKVWNEQGLSYAFLTIFSFSFWYLSKCIIYWFETLRTTETLQLKHEKNSYGFFCAVWNFWILKFKRISLGIYYIQCHKNTDVFFPHSTSNVSVNCKVSDSNIVC
jgi:hypothetical protein